MGQLAKIKIVDVRENPVALRTVDRESEQYLGLCESIKSKGFVGAITVREKVDPETKRTYFELIDGLHRFSAARDVGLTEINADILALDDNAVLEAQIMANIHKIETRPIEYTKQLQRILSNNPMITESELATRLGKSPKWIQDRLSLQKIENEGIQHLINDGKIPLANAYALAKLPVDEQPNWVERAMTEKPMTFIAEAQKRAAEIRNQKRKGLEAEPVTFTPTAHLQLIRDIKQRIEDPTLLKQALAKAGINNPLDAAIYALKWTLHLDPDSVAAAQAKWEQQKQEREAQAAKRKAEREQRKAEAAKQAAAAVVA